MSKATIVTIEAPNVDDAWWIAKKLMGPNPLQQASRLPDIVMGLTERSASIKLVAALQKTQEGDFATPLQGMYAGANVETGELRAAYKTG
jgi:hypothetical protein